MTDIPIIFSAPMVRALLGGRKTMTRRLAWRVTSSFRAIGEVPPNGVAPTTWQSARPGDRLWVRETWQLHSVASDKATVVYAASINASWTEAHNQFPIALACGLRAPRPFQEGWRSPLHLPRWASRLTLTITGTKIERLQKISNTDAIAEGCGVNFDHENPERTRETFPAERFRDLWARLHGMDDWDANPEVVALTFTVHKHNIDTMIKTDAA